MKVRDFILVFVIAAFGGIAAGAVVAQESEPKTSGNSALTPEDAKQLEILKAQWQSQREAIYSVHVYQNKFSNSGDFRPLSPEDVLEIFKPDELAEDPEQLRTVVNTLLISPLKADPPWSEVEFVKDGEKIRDETPYAIHTFDGEDEVHRDDFNSVIRIGMTPGNNYYLTTIDDMRFIPNDAFTASFKRSERFDTDLRFFSQSPSRQEEGISANPADHPSVLHHRWVQVDTASGMVTLMFEIDDRHGKEKVDLVIQGGFLKLDGEIQWPRSHGSFQFIGKPPILLDATISITKKVEINGIVDPSAFVVAANPNDRIIDNRSQFQTDIKTRVPVNNAKTPLTARSVRPVSGWRWPIVLGNLLAITLVGLGMFLRRLIHKTQAKGKS